MEFSTCSEKWTLNDCRIQPSELLRLVLQACCQRLPPDALGHAKAYAEYLGGQSFASSTVTPAGVTLRDEGHYEGGAFEIGITLIFMDLPVSLLEKVLLEAADEACGQSGCLIIERKEV